MRIRQNTDSELIIVKCIVFNLHTRRLSCRMTG
jgi:hypothetical protein